MKAITITPEDQEIIQFLQRDVDRKDLAKYVRRAVYIMSKVALDKNKEDEGCIFIKPDWLEKGFYWLNKFAEVLDPYLDKED